MTGRIVVVRGSKIKQELVQRATRKLSNTGRLHALGEKARLPVRQKDRRQEFAAGKACERRSLYKSLLLLQRGLVDGPMTGKNRFSDRTNERSWRRKEVTRAIADALGQAALEPASLPCPNGKGSGPAWPQPRRAGRFMLLTALCAADALS